MDGGAGRGGGGGIEAEAEDERESEENARDSVHDRSAERSRCAREKAERVGRKRDESSERPSYLRVPIYREQPQQFPVRARASASLPS